MEPIKIEIGHSKKWRNSQEYHHEPFAICEEFGLENRSYSALTRVIQSLASLEVDFSRLVEIRKGETIVFNKVPLKVWLEDKRPDYLKREKKND